MMCLTQLEEQAKHVNAALGVNVDVPVTRRFNFDFPIRIYSEANERGSHWPRTNRFRKQRAQLAWSLFSIRRLYPHLPPPLPVEVTLTRLGVKFLDDDNLAGGFKAVRDEVAAWLGVDDRSPLVEWRYAQERAKEYAVRISIEEKQG